MTLLSIKVKRPLGFRKLTLMIKMAVEIRRVSFRANQMHLLTERSKNMIVHSQIKEEKGV